MRNQLILIVALYAVFVAKLAYFATELPERMASHFGVAGEANGWMSGSGYLIFMAAFGLLMPLLLPAVFMLLPRIPNSLINLPHRDYWLAPERRVETMAYMQRHAWWLSCLELALVIVLHDLVMRANQQDPARLSNAIWAVMAVFLVGVAAWCWTLFHHFRLPKLRAAPLSS